MYVVQDIQIKKHVILNQTILQDSFTITGIWTHVLNYKQDLYIINFTITEHVKKKTGIPRQYGSACLYIDGQGQSIVSCSVLIKTQLCCLKRECIYCVQPTNFESLSRKTSSQSDMFVDMHTLSRIMFFSVHPYALTPN